MISQEHITSETSMGATLLSDGATFRAWAPRALQVFCQRSVWRYPNARRASRAAHGAGSKWVLEGISPACPGRRPYKFVVVGEGSSGFKRDPYARELSIDQPFPNSGCILRPSSAYPWHDAEFRTPDFSDMIVYQLHVGTYSLTRPGRYATFLDVIDKIDYLVALGVNVLQSCQ